MGPVAYVVDAVLTLGFGVQPAVRRSTRAATPRSR